MSGKMVVLERRPAHVPEWVWDGYKRHIAKVSEPDWEPEYLVDVSLATRIELFNGIVASANSAALWKALELHRDEFDQLWGTPDADRHVVNIFEATEFTCAELHAQRSLTTAERRPYALAVATAATALAESLHEILSLSRPDEMAYPAEFPRFKHEDMMTILEGIRRGANDWLAASPVVDRPNREGSERRFFIRQMTTHLEEIYPSARMERVAGLLADCIDFPGLGLTWARSGLRKQVKSVRSPKVGGI